MKNAPLLVIAAAGLAAGCVMGPDDYPRRSVNELARYGPPAEPVATGLPRVRQRRALNSEMGAPAGLVSPAPAATGRKPGAGPKKGRPTVRQQTAAAAHSGNRSNSEQTVNDPPNPTEPQRQTTGPIAPEGEGAPATTSEAVAVAPEAPAIDESPAPPAPSAAEQPPDRAALLVEQPSAPRETDAPAEPDYTGPLFDVVAIRTDAAGAEQVNVALDDAGVTDRFTMDKGDRFLIYLGRYKSQAIAQRRVGEIKRRAGIGPEIRQVR